MVRQELRPLSYEFNELAQSRKRMLAVRVTNTRFRSSARCRLALNVGEIKPVVENLVYVVDAGFVERGKKL